MQSVGTAFDQVFAFLAPAGFHIGVMAIGKDGHEDLHRDHFICVPIDDVEFLTGKIDEKLMAGAVLELHGAFYFSIFTVVMFHELRVAIRVVHLPGHIPGNDRGT